MSNQLKNRELRGRFGVGALILTMAISAGATGCSTHYVQSAAGEPATITTAGGSAASRAVITPATAGAPPMISGAVDPSVDAIAVLEASRAFQGRVLGPAAPGDNTAGISQQYATGQFVPPAVYLGGATPTMSIAGGTNLVVGTGVAAAPATGSTVLATPTLGTSARLSVNTTAVVGTPAATGVRVETSPAGRTVVTNSKP